MSRLSEVELMNENLKVNYISNNPNYFNIRIANEDLNDEDLVSIIMIVNEEKENEPRCKQKEKQLEELYRKKLIENQNFYGRYKEHDFSDVFQELQQQQQQKRTQKSLDFKKNFSNVNRQLNVNLFDASDREYEYDGNIRVQSITKLKKNKGILKSLNGKSENQRIPFSNLLSNTFLLNETSSSRISNRMNDHERVYLGIPYFSQYNGGLEKNEYQYKADDHGNEDYDDYDKEQYKSNEKIKRAQENEFYIKQHRFPQIKHYLSDQLRLKKKLKEMLERDNYYAHNSSNFFSSLNHFCPNMSSLKSQSNQYIYRSIVHARSAPNTAIRSHINKQSLEAIESIVMYNFYGQFRLVPIEYARPKMPPTFKKRFSTIKPPDTYIENVNLLDESCNIQLHLLPPQSNDLSKTKNKIKRKKKASTKAATTCNTKSIKSKNKSFNQIQNQNHNQIQYESNIINNPNQLKKSTELIIDDRPYRSMSNGLCSTKLSMLNRTNSSEQNQPEQQQETLTNFTLNDLNIIKFSHNKYENAIDTHQKLMRQSRVVFCKSAKKPADLIVDKTTYKANLPCLDEFELHENNNFSSQTKLKLNPNFERAKRNPGTNNIINDSNSSTKGFAEKIILSKKRFSCVNNLINNRNRRLTESLDSIAEEELPRENEPKISVLAKKEKEIINDELKESLSFKHLLMKNNLSRLLLRSNCYPKI
jgi:hypothetical protein